MQSFLRKINDNYQYKQFLPNKTIKKKGTPKTIDRRISGLSGEALLEKIYFIISKHSDEISQCKAILIEDDLDGRFSQYTGEDIIRYNQKIIDQIHEKLGAKIPVFLLYASPEVESWFIADWKNGFEYLYCKSDIISDIDWNARYFFNHHFKQYTDYHILKEYKDNLEEYGWFEGQYLKLSDEIIKAVQTEIKEYIKKIPSANPSYIKQIIESRKLYYSKKLHGDRMLRNIQPQLVAERCTKYFKNTYNQLFSFSD